MKEKSQARDWLADEDLSSYQTARAKNWPKKCLAVEQFANNEPWRRIQDPHLRAYMILLWLQNGQLRPALKQQEKQTRELRAVVDSLKRALEEEVLHGVDYSVYSKCWAAWSSGTAELVKQLQDTIESTRAEWRVRCEIEAKEKHKGWMRRNAKILRERAPGFSIEVDWFAPLPIYNHTAHSDHAEWGYCQATGQDRKKVSAFLKAKKQYPIEFPKRKGAGRPLPLYGFETNLLVLGKWLGDWLPNARGGEFQYHDSSVPGKTFIVPGPERVCEAIDRTVRHAAHEQHTDDQAKQFLAVLRKQLSRWKGRVKDPEMCRWIPGLEKRLAPDGRAWLDFVQERRSQWAEHTAMTKAGYERKHGEWVQGESKPTGPMPYEEIRHAFKRYRERLK